MIIDFGLLLYQYQMYVFSCNDNDGVDIKFDISLMNDDNYLEYIRYVLNSIDNTNQWRNIFESAQNANDLCDSDSNISQSEGYQCILPWIDFWMQSFCMNYSFPSSINVKQFDVNCLSIILWYKLFVCINDDDIKSEQDKYQFMIGILDIIFDNFDHKMKHFILKHHFESILYFICLKWKDCRLESMQHQAWNRLQCMQIYISPDKPNPVMQDTDKWIDVEQKTMLDEIITISMTSIANSFHYKFSFIYTVTLFSVVSANCCLCYCL